jgi:hypothetical protein
MNKALTLIAFAALGLLVGNVSGLSDAAVTLPLIAALFAFVGGSAIAFLKDVPDAQRGSAALAITGLAIGCLLGVYLGILVREHQLLTPQARRFIATPSEQNAPVTQSGVTRYLRSSDVQRLGTIDAARRRGALTAQEAYDSLYNLIREENTP